MRDKKRTAGGNALKKHLRWKKEFGKNEKKRRLFFSFFCCFWAEGLV